ncbi:MAG TPA: hypothetical protein VF032_15040 [Thermoleophilaceae bacterium]
MGDVLHARALARAKVRARRKRVTLIRRRTFWFSMAVFAVAWAVIFAQMVGGHDPALANKKKARPQPVVEHRQAHARPVRHHVRRRHHHHHHTAPAPTNTTTSSSTPAPAPTATPAPTPTPAPVTPAPAPAPAPAPVTTSQS